MKKAVAVTSEDGTLLTPFHNYQQAGCAKNLDKILLDSIDLVANAHEPLE